MLNTFIVSFYINIKEVLFMRILPPPYPAIPSECPKYGGPHCGYEECTTAYVPPVCP